MAGEWREVAIGELAEIFDGPHATPPKTSHGPVFLGISNLAQGRLDLANTEHLSEEDYVRWTRRVEPQAGDVVFSYETRLGEAAFIPPGLRFCLGRRMGLLRARTGKVDRRFLLYAYLGPQFQETLRARTIHGSTVDRIPLIDMPRFPIEVPDGVDEQRAVAHILGTLDDKIELNRQMNETLEAIARALFKSWFVDFDPVRAKAEGRDTGLPPHIADLFPDSFEDSELGEIPKGWEMRSLDEIAGFLNGLALQKYPPRDSSWLPVIKIAQLRAGNTRGADRASAELDPVYAVEDGDILFSWSGSLECVLWAGGKGALNQHLFKVTSATHPRWLCYLGIHQHLDEFRQIAAGKATTMGHIQRHHLSSAKLPVPPPGLLQAMSVYVQPILESTWYRKVQSRALAALRDALLPKLISGELRASGLKYAIADVDDSGVGQEARRQA
jgi:type I restriction enzyme S subunit